MTFPLAFRNQVVVHSAQESLDVQQPYPWSGRALQVTPKSAALDPCRVRWAVSALRCAASGPPGPLWVQLQAPNREAADDVPNKTHEPGC